MTKKIKTKIRTLFSVVGMLLVVGWVTARASTAQEQETREVVKEAQKLKEGQKTAIKELTIRNSGFRSRSTVIIRYRDEDKAIVEVIENGKSLPVSEFPRYEPVMRKVLELPEMNRLIPEIDRAYRLAESYRVPEERVFEEMMGLSRRLERMNSEVAHRYREQTELQAVASINRMAEQISESEGLSPTEKIQELKALVTKTAELAAQEEIDSRRTRFSRFAANEAARKLIEEIELTDQLSQEEKLQEIRALLRQTREMNFAAQNERREGLVEFKAAETLSRMLHEISEREDLSEQEKELQMQELINESRRMNLASGDLMIGVEKFKYDLHRFLEKEGLLPEGKAEFVLKKNSSTIDGNKLPGKIHETLKRMCVETIGKTFEGDTKIVLQLNEKR